MSMTSLLIQQNSLQKISTCTSDSICVDATPLYVMAMAGAKLFTKGASHHQTLWIENGFTCDFINPEPFTKKSLKPSERDGEDYPIVNCRWCGRK